MSGSLEDAALCECGRSGINQDRWDLNMAAIMQWARTRGKQISIFAAKHGTERGKTTGSATKAMYSGEFSGWPIAFWPCHELVP